MKRIASTLAIIGVATGALVALWPWILGARDSAPASFLIPLIFGVVIMATHWFTFRKIHAGSGTRLGLLLPNAALLIIILLSVLFLPPSPAGDDRSVLWMILLPAAFLLPLASNVLYLSFGSRPSGG